MTKQELIAEIREAFANEVYPGDTNIVTPFEGDSEREEFADSFRGKTWQSVPNELLFYERDSLPFFTPAGYKYYLPAFLIFVVDDYYEADTLTDNLILQLTLPTEIDVAIMAQTLGSPDVQERFPSTDFTAILQSQLQSMNQSVHRFIDRFRSFTPEQGRVAKHFLAFMGEEHRDDFLRQEPAIAIERYWFQFDE